VPGAGIMGGSETEKRAPQVAEVVPPAPKKSAPMKAEAHAPAPKAEIANAKSAPKTEPAPTAVATRTPVPAPTAVATRTPAPTTAPETEKPLPAAGTSAARVTSSEPESPPTANATAPPNPAPAPASAAAAIKRPDKVRVKSGETMMSIARRYNTSVAAIMMENNLVSDQVRSGQMLKIPNHQ